MRDFEGEVEEGPAVDTVGGGGLMCESLNVQRGLR